MSRQSKKKRDDARRRSPDPRSDPQADALADADAPDETPDDCGPTPDDPLAAVTKERDDLLARLQRLSADYLNYQKRVQRDIEQTREYANEELIKALLAVLDDMERALAAARANHDEDDPLLKGMQLVHDKAIDTLGKFGVTVIDAEGKPFDPDLHSAMMQQPSAEHPPQTVLTELVRGYQLRERTIRPSGVVVSCLPEEPGDDAEDET